MKAKGHQINILIIPLVPWTLKSLSNLNDLNPTVLYNLDILIFNAQTNEAEFFIYHHYKGSKLEKRSTTNFSGTFKNRNTNMQQRPLKVLGPKTNNLQGIQVIANQTLSIITSYLNASTIFSFWDPTQNLLFADCYEKLVSHEVDVCLCIDSYLPSPLNGVDYVSLEQPEEIMILVNQKAFDISLDIFLQPYDTTFWVFYVLQFLFCVVLWSIIYKIYDWVHGILTVERNVVLILVESSINASISFKTKTLVEKFLFGSHIIFNFIVLTAYSSLLVSYLLNATGTEMNTIKEFKDANMTLLRKGGDVVFTVKYAARGIKSITDFNRVYINNSLQPLSDPKYGYSLTKTLARHFLNSKQHLVQSEKRLHMLKEPLYSYDLVLPISDSLMITHELENLMMRVRQSGLDHYWRTCLAYFNLEYETQKNIQDKLSDVKYLRMKDLSIIFKCFLWAMFASILVFVCECIVFKINEFLETLEAYENYLSLGFEF